jgi:hypothetical protein
MNPERQAAKVNVRIALPYVHNSILNAMDKAREIGTCKETNFDPDPVREPAYIELRKKD